MGDDEALHPKIQMAMPGFAGSPATRSAARCSRRRLTDDPGIRAERIEEELRRTKEQLAEAQALAIVTASDDAILAYSPDGEVTTWNPGAERLYGFASQVAHAERYGHGGAVLVLDLDDFKYVNDTVGHGSGGDLLRHLAGLLTGRLRQTDVVARIGGDEFAVPPHASEPDARAVAGELIEAVRHSTVVASGHTLRYTISIGNALFDDTSAPPDDLLASASQRCTPPRTAAVTGS